MWSLIVIKRMTKPHVKLNMDKWLFHAPSYGKDAFHLRVKILQIYCDSEAELFLPI